jgi:putative transposase
VPARNVIRTFVEDSYYHLYNRGVEKRLIFQDFQDYAVFMSYLKHYLTPPMETEQIGKRLSTKAANEEIEPVKHDTRLRNFGSDLYLTAYSLMPNHYHLLVKQKSRRVIEHFMGSLSIRYTMYFNRKYDRVGALFQGVYKAVLVESDEHLLALTRYIHKQSLLLEDDNLREIQPCSFGEFIGKRKTDWVHPEEIMDFFSSSNYDFSYQQFVKEWVKQEIENSQLETKLLLE